MPTHLDTLTPLQLAERAKIREAQKRLNEVTGADGLLVEGGIVFFDDPERAKDLLSRAASESVGETRAKALIWLACAYWHTGETDEAKATLECVEQLTDDIRFVWGYTRSVVEPHHKQAMAFLKIPGRLIDFVDNPLWKGKFFTQRAYLHRQLKNTDKAIQDYQAAIMWHERNDDPVRVARVKNNLAFVYKDVEQFDDAHEHVDAAIRILTGALKAQAYDQKAEIYLAQQDYVSAEKSALKSVALLEHTDHKKLLADSLVTLAQASAGLEKFTDASKLLDRAIELAGFLSNKDLLIFIYQGRRKVAAITETVCKERAIRLTLESTSSVLLAADKLDVTREAVYQFKAKYNLK